MVFVIILQCVYKILVNSFTFFKLFKVYLIFNLRIVKYKVQKNGHFCSLLSKFKRGVKAVEALRIICSVYAINERTAKK